MYKIDAFCPKPLHYELLVSLNPLKFYSWMVHKATQEKRDIKSIHVSQGIIQIIKIYPYFFVLIF